MALFGIFRRMTRLIRRKNEPLRRVRRVSFWMTVGIFDVPFVAWQASMD